jgi:UDP-N-acetyl-2-amino-2-deoxyglucuronate dehydrogenase
MHPLGTALVGLGKVAKTHADALAHLPGSAFVAVCDTDPERRSSFARAYGVKAYDQFDDLLRDPSVEVVDICTPHPLHAELTVRAARAGKNILVEKPMAVRLSDCDAMIGAASAAGVKLGVISQRRFYQPVQRMHQAIAEGRIGKPALGTLTVLGWRSPEYYKLDPWRGTWSGEGGGVLVTQATHHLDLFQWFMGPVAELYGYWANANHPGIEVEDTAVAVLRFKTGALGVIAVSNAQKPGLFGRIHVHGDSGASVGVQTESGSAFIAGMTTEVAPPINDIWTIPGEEDLLTELQRRDTECAANVNIMEHYHALQIDDFLHAVVEDRMPAVSGEEGRKSVELFTAIYQSQRDHRPVHFPLSASSE